MCLYIPKPLSVPVSDVVSADRRADQQPLQSQHFRLFGELLRPFAKALCIATLVSTPSVYAAELSIQALSTPSEISPLAQHSLMLDVASTGSRLVSVGQFGHILYSDDEGAHWIQAEAPVSSTLTAVHFADEQTGWAVGHEGVVLTTENGGKSWMQQLNGLEINQLMLDRAKTLYEYPTQNSGEMPPGIHPELTADDLETLVFDAEDFNAEGASRPLMDVWFKNRREGIVVGAYGLILHTSDGGQSWTPGFDTVYNIDSFHYYDIIPAPSQQQPDAIFLVGEAGLLQRSLDNGQTWKALDAPYDGTFFGGLYNTGSHTLLVYGLRGNLYHSSDLGDSWQPINSKTTASIFDGSVLANGSMLLVGSAGLQVTVDGETFETESGFSQQRTPYSAITLSPSGNAVLAGLRGIELATDQESQP